MLTKLHPISHAKVTWTRRDVVLNVDESVACRCRAQRQDRSSTILQVPSVLLAAGLAVGLLLTPVAADAKQQPASPAQTRGLKQQREVQEKMCGQEWKRLDQILMQQMKEREAQTKRAAGTSEEAVQGRKS